MPRVIRMPLTIATRDRPDAQYFGLAVTLTGRIVYIRSRDESPIIMVLDSTGRRVAAFGRTGDGPGEFRTPSRIFVSGDTLTLVARSGGVFVRYLADGSLIGEFDSRVFDDYLAVTGDSLDHVNLLGNDRSIWRTPLTGNGRGRLLLSDTDSILRQAEIPPWDGASVEPPPYAVHDGAFIVGAGPPYLLARHEVSGSTAYVVHRSLQPMLRGPRELAEARDALRRALNARGPDGAAEDPRPIEERLNHIDRQSMPRFGRNSLFVDDESRLWVVGMADDSTHADVFADSAYLGSVQLPCYDRYMARALNGRWLVLNCSLGDDHDPPYELQLYRITDSL